MTVSITTEFIDKSQAGVQQYERNVKAAEKITDQFAMSAETVAKNLGQMGDQAAQTARQLATIDQASASTTKSLGNYNAQLQMAIYGVDDFVTVASMQNWSMKGIAAATGAAANNFGVLLSSIHPLATLIPIVASAAIRFGSNLMSSGENAKEAAQGLNEYSKALQGYQDRQLAATKGAEAANKVADERKFQEAIAGEIEKANQLYRVRKEAIEKLQRLQKESEQGQRVRSVFADSLKDAEAQFAAADKAFDDQLRKGKALRDAQQSAASAEKAAEEEKKKQARDKLNREAEERNQQIKSQKQWEEFRQQEREADAEEKRRHAERLQRIKEADEADAAYAAHKKQRADEEKRRADKEKADRAAHMAAEAKRNLDQQKGGSAKDQAIAQVAAGISSEDVKRQIAQQRIDAEEKKFGGQLSDQRKRDIRAGVNREDRAGKLSSSDQIDAQNALLRQRLKAAGADDKTLQDIADRGEAAKAAAAEREKEDSLLRRATGGQGRTREERKADFQAQQQRRREDFQRGREQAGKGRDLDADIAAQQAAASGPSTQEKRNEQEFRRANNLGPTESQQATQDRIASSRQRGQQLRQQTQGAIDAAKAEPQAEAATNLADNVDGAAKAIAENSQKTTEELGKAAAKIAELNQTVQAQAQQLDQIGQMLGAIQPVRKTRQQDIRRGVGL